jgi:hypothetical protein
MQFTCYAKKETPKNVAGVTVVGFYYFWLTENGELEEPCFLVRYALQTEHGAFLLPQPRTLDEARAQFFRTGTDFNAETDWMATQGFSALAAASFLHVIAGTEAATGMLIMEGHTPAAPPPPAPPLTPPSRITL